MSESFWCELVSVCNLCVSNIGANVLIFLSPPSFLPLPPLLPSIPRSFLPSLPPSILPSFLPSLLPSFLPFHHSIIPSRAGIFQVVSAVLHFGNMKFKQERSSDQALLPDNTVAQKLCKLLGVSVTDFTKALLKPRIKTGREFTVRSQNVAQVRDFSGGKKKNNFLSAVNQEAFCTR